MASTHLTVAAGLISGTSMDAVDAACIATDGRRRCRYIAAASVPYDAPLRARLLAVAADAELARSPLAELQAQLDRANLAALDRLFAQLPARVRVELIGLHGQTVLHEPAARFTRQLGSGAALANQLGIDVIDQFRHADLAGGGQGAPLAPAYHACLAAGTAKPLAILNLGGVANLTYLDDGQLLAFDTGPASALLDDLMRLRCGAQMDQRVQYWF